MSLARGELSNSKSSRRLIASHNPIHEPAIAIYDPRHPNSPRVLEGIPAEAETIDAIDSCGAKGHNRWLQTKPSISRFDLH